ncbi:hypothetical protein F5148DRAFT_541384 [Russula earlei]|uniref:Uncharacterized protein n=1 Tax=Russula earlei TaxID=71964 RepID=A0ACC0UIJ9_9AGAM|nr:hypothetical protein F5148DRAFT_541384 [Russula earlei]
MVVPIFQSWVAHAFPTCLGQRSMADGPDGLRPRIWLNPNTSQPLTGKMPLDLKKTHLPFVVLSPSSCMSFCECARRRSRLSSPEAHDILPTTRLPSIWLESNGATNPRSASKQKGAFIPACFFSTSFGRCHRPPASEQISRIPQRAELASSTRKGPFTAFRRAPVEFSVPHRLPFSRHPGLSLGFAFLVKASRWLSPPPTSQARASRTNH